MNKVQGLLIGVFSSLLFSSSYSFADQMPTKLDASARPHSRILARYSHDELNDQNVWFVSAQDGLNCRKGPGVEYEAVYEDLMLYTALVAFDFVGERGVTSSRDLSGLLWLRVLPRGPVRPEPCYVAADSRFIQPEFPDQTWSSNLELRGEDRTCELNRPGTANQARLTTESHVIYLCSQNTETIPHVHFYLAFKRETSQTMPSLVLEKPDFDPRNGGQYIFRNGNYNYLIDLPSLRYPSAFLSVVFPDGSGYDEMILEWLD